MGKYSRADIINGTERTLKNGMLAGLPLLLAMPQVENIKFFFFFNTCSTGSVF